MNIKRILAFFIAIFTLFSLAACGHVHTYSTEWEYDGDSHWHKATCGHTEERTDEAPHRDTDSDGACDECGYSEAHVHTYDTSEWEYDEMNHWYKATCEHTGEKDSLAAHSDSASDSDSLCDECGYDTHEHTFDTSHWVFNASGHWHASSCGHNVKINFTSHSPEMTEPCPVCGYDPADAPALPDFTPSAQLLPVKGGAGGIVVIVHDDAVLSTGNMLDGLLSEYGLVGDVAMFVDAVKNNSASISGWRSLLTNGNWKLISHSATHTWWGTGAGSEERLYNEVVGSQATLREYFPGQRVLTFAYPGLSDATATHGHSAVFSKELYDLVSETYIGGRWYSELIPNDVNSFDVWENMGAYFLTTGNINGGSLGTRLELASEGSMQIFCIHGLTTDTTAPEGGYNLPYVDMEKACEMISEYTSDGRVWNAHYEDAVMYLREAQSATLKVAGDANAIWATLTDTLDDSVYNFPLTVRISVPRHWAAANMTVGGSVKYLEAKELDGKWIVEADIVPDSGIAVFTSAGYHTLDYSDEWTSDETHHWHAAVCSIHDSCALAFKDKAEHTDTDSDGECDECERTMSVVISVENADNLSHTIPTGKVNIGESVTFTVTVGKSESVRIVGALQIGDPVTSGDTKTYTYKIESVGEGSAVKIVLLANGQIDLSGDGVWNVISGGALGGITSTVVWEKNGVFTSTEPSDKTGYTEYTIRWYSFGTAGPNVDGSAYVITKKLEIKSIKRAGSDDETEITWNGKSYAAGDIVYREGSNYWLGLADFMGWASPSTVFGPAATATAANGEVAVFEATFKFELGDYHHNGSYYVASDIVSLVVRDAAASNKITSGFTVDGGPSNYLDVKCPSTARYYQAGVTGRGHVGEEFTVRFEIYESVTAGKYEVKTIVGGVLIDTATVDAFDVTSVKIENINSQIRDVKITVSDVIFIKYTR